MLKRPLNPRFSQAVLEGRKITTIRDSFWPTDVPIMLYNWSGAAYRSKQIDVAAVTVKGVLPIEIHRREDGEMFYSCNLCGARMLHETEGFESREELDAWFRPLLKPGQTVTKFLMRFRLTNERGHPARDENRPPERSDVYQPTD